MTCSISWTVHRPHKPVIQGSKAPMRHGWTQGRSTSRRCSLRPVAFLSTNPRSPSAGRQPRFGHVWLPPKRARGLNVEEVSLAPAMNRGCGAGELAPGARWTWDEAAQEDHLLLRHVRPAPEGTLLGAALDGDGDRCLLLVAEAGGPAVVDGDAMALRLLEAAATDRAWTLAASIESDLALTSRANRWPICTT